MSDAPPPPTPSRPPPPAPAPAAPSVPPAQAPAPPPSPMHNALVDLREALRATSLPLDVPGVDPQRAARTELVEQLDDYVLPRLSTLDAPLLAVVGGSTGAGKSTLVNSIVGATVTAPGVLRPTTRSPVLVHHPEDARFFGQDRVFPDLERVRRPTSDPHALQMVSSTTLPPGLAVLDAPDVDSVEEDNRRLAAQLLAAADLWLFVTTAARYADQVPWDYLKQAAERSAAVAIVLDRTPAAAIPEVSSHLARMLTSRGLSESPLFAVHETAVDEDGLLPPIAVAQVRAWLAGLAADQEARDAMVRQTLEGAIRSLAQRSHRVADAGAEQLAVQGRLARDAQQAYADARSEITTGTADGTMLRGEVLARWQDFVGTGELLRGLESRVSWLRDRLTGALKGKPQQATKVTVAVESGLHTLLLERAEEAAERAAASWGSVEAGRRLLDAAPADLGRASRSFRGDAERAVREWQQGIVDLVRTEGAAKRSTARFLAFGVNGLAVALMVVIFASTGGLLGGEIGVAGASAVVGQKLLEAVFGDQAVRRLATVARTDLDRRVALLLDAELARFSTLLAAQEISAEAPERVRRAAREVDDLRFSDRRQESP